MVRMHGAKYLEKRIIEMSVKNTFGKRLKLLRECLFLSQYELAKVLNVSPSAVGMYEQGRRSPSLDTLVMIANYFDVSIDYFVGRSNNY